MKTLSLIILTSHNTLYLGRCLDSIKYYQDLEKDIEIIITDSLKSGIKKTSGKYCSILEEKEFVNIDTFPGYFEKLKTETSDLILTNDALTLKTEKIKKLELSFVEEIPFAFKRVAKTISEYNSNVYERNMPESKKDELNTLFEKSVKIEKAIKLILKKYPESYFREKIVALVNDYYRAYFIRSILKKEEKKRLLKFDIFLKTKYPIIYKDISAAKLLKIRLSPISKTTFFKLASNLKRN